MRIGGGCRVPPCCRAAGRLKWLFRTAAWVAAVSIVSACGSPAGYGPSVAAVAESRRDGPEAAPGALADRSLRMKRGASSRRVASTRMIERAKRLLRSGHYTLALSELEKSLSTGGSSPHVHYYIARAHHQLGNFKASLDFLDVAEPMLGNDPPWLVRSLVLRGDNHRALGQFDAAGAAYRRALSMDPSNPSAKRGLISSRQRSRTKSW